MSPVIRPGRVDEIHLLAEAFRQMWRDNDIAETSIEPDYRERVEQFVRAGIERDGLQFFLAEHEGEMVGAAACQWFAGLYPAILIPEVRRYGYVWGIYVAPAQRRRGLGRRLTERCIAALQAIGCTHVLLHAAPPGRGVYERLGFQPTNEMRLTLRPVSGPG
jgi:ribosomal protein S18 acetylase RimI-like enzyme